MRRLRALAHRLIPKSVANSLFRAVRATWTHAGGARRADYSGGPNKVSVQGRRGQKNVLLTPLGVDFFRRTPSSESPRWPVSAADAHMRGAKPPARADCLSADRWAKRKACRWKTFCARLGRGLALLPSDGKGPRSSAARPPQPRTPEGQARLPAISALGRHGGMRSGAFDYARRT